MAGELQCPACSGSGKTSVDLREVIRRAKKHRGNQNMSMYAAVQKYCTPLEHKVYLDAGAPYFEHEVPE
jgi:hypothetical protein